MTLAESTVKAYKTPQKQAFFTYQPGSRFTLHKPGVEGSSPSLAINFCRTFFVGHVLNVPAVFESVENVLREKWYSQTINQASAASVASRLVMLSRFPLSLYSTEVMKDRISMIPRPPGLSRLSSSVGSGTSTILKPSP